MTGLTGKTAWITGAGTGIGAESAVALAQSGARVILSGRRRDPLEAVAARIAQAGGTAEVAPLDTSDRDAVAGVAQRFPQIDILVASAGLNVADRALQSIAPESWESVVNVNLTGVFNPVHALLPGMRARGDGCLILVSSWAGRYATRMTGAAYNATKRAVLALSETINEEEGGHGIRSCVIMPGEVATDILKSRPVPPSQADMDRMLQAEDLARTVRFVAESPAHVCLNEILISPTWNRFYQGMAEV